MLRSIMASMEQVDNFKKIKYLIIILLDILIKRCSKLGKNHFQIFFK